jgi:hypothetical protein
MEEAALVGSGPSEGGTPTPAVDVAVDGVCPKQAWAKASVSRQTTTRDRHRRILAPLRALVGMLLDR